MPNMLQQGSRWLGQQRRSSASVRVTYRTPDGEVDLSAGLGQTEFTRETNDGAAAINVVTRDYFISASDLYIDGVKVEPARGHKIVETDSLGVEREHEVGSPDTASQPWRWHENARLTYRVHTHQTDETDPESTE